MEDKGLHISIAPHRFLLLILEHIVVPQKSEGIFLSFSPVLTLNEGLELEQGCPFCTGCPTHVQGQAAPCYFQGQLDQSNHNCACNHFVTVHLPVIETFLGGGVQV